MQSRTASAEKPAVGAPPGAPVTTLSVTVDGAIVAVLRRCAKAMPYTSRNSETGGV